MPTNQSPIVRSVARALSILTVAFVSIQIGADASQVMAQAPNTDVIQIDRPLKPGDYIVSSNQKYFAKVEGGRFGVYVGTAPNIANAELVWSVKGDFVYMQGDGHLLVFEGTNFNRHEINKLTYKSGVVVGGKFVALNNTGNLVMYGDVQSDERRKILWTNANLGSVLKVDRHLYGNAFMSSPRRKYYAMMDGPVLKVFTGKSPLHSELKWGAFQYNYDFDKWYDTTVVVGAESDSLGHVIRTSYKGRVGAVLQGDGNLVFFDFDQARPAYRDTGNPLWASGVNRGRFLHLTDQGQLKLCQTNPLSDSSAVVKWKTEDPGKRPIKLFKESYTSISQPWWRIQTTSGKEKNFRTGEELDEQEVCWTQTANITPTVVLKEGNRKNESTALVWDYKNTQKLRHDRTVFFEPVVANLQEQNMSRVGAVQLNLFGELRRATGNTELTIIDRSEFMTKGYSHSDSLVGPYLESVKISFKPIPRNSVWKIKATGPENMNKSGNYTHSSSFNVGAGSSGEVSGGYSESYGSSADLQDFEFEEIDNLGAAWYLSQVYEQPTKPKSYVRTSDILVKKAGQYSNTCDAPVLSRINFDSLAYQVFETTDNRSPNEKFSLTLQYEVTFRMVVMTKHWDNLVGGKKKKTVIPAVAAGAIAGGAVAGPAGAGVGALIGWFASNKNVYSGKLGKEWTSYKYVHKFDVNLVVPKELLKR